jgi:4-amino-4-deoxy-L-arabinose transferase-like glycosyltransferase
MSSRLRLRLLLAAILLAGFWFRVYDLLAIPPGLTHDEANHGREAFGILEGRLALFFPLNYGSEPLYSYTVAGLMALLGRNLLALRLVTVVFNLAAVAVTYLWARRALGMPVAIVGAALMAVSFWPVAAAREALRAGMMPFFAAGAAVFFWLLVTRRTQERSRTGWLVAGFALCLTATLYNYLAARVWWLLFPAFLAYLALAHRPQCRQLWRPALAGLLLAGVLVAPMFVYLESHPEAQTRLQMLDSTLGRALQGEMAPLVRNVAGALLAFVWPGQGDRFLAYNIPGRPVLDALSALFFAAGLMVALWRWRKPAYAFLLLWLVAGIIPSLLTGATANTTRNAGAMPATYLLAATGFVAFSGLVRQRRESLRTLLGAAALAWVFFTAVLTADAYFRRWGQDPDVRAAYQHTLVAQVEYLKAEAPQTAVISSIYPGAAHDPGIGLVMAGVRPEWRWVDARTAVVFPGGAPSLLAAPSSTPLHPFFTHWSYPVDMVQLRPDDLDPYFTVMQMTPPSWPAEAVAEFGGEGPAVALLQAGWREASGRAGEVAEMVLVWRVIEPAGVGPVQAEIDATDAVFFTHVMAGEGTVLAQQDAITAPSWDWQAGDIVVQIHQIAIPAESAPGTYETRVGLYDRQSEQRLPRFGASAEVPVDTAIVESLRIIP